MPASGSMVRGDLAGKMALSYSFYENRQQLFSGSQQPFIFSLDNKQLTSGSIAAIKQTRDDEAEPRSVGFLQGLAFGAPTTIDGGGSFGRHMQVGVNRENNDGTPAAPSLRLDYPGMWRFRWVVKNGNRSISVSARQNSTGSFRPSMIVRKNPGIQIFNDISASAPDGAGWVNMGPITFTASGSDVVWVELHNNNHGVMNMEGVLLSQPAFFDHIVGS